MVMPPLLEYLESLLTSGGADLRLRTFKLVDQLSGRMMGIRADITPQVARIDSHLLNREGVTRLCYCGPVLHTRPRGLDSTREPIQIGAELQAPLARVVIGGLAASTMVTLVLVPSVYTLFEEGLSAFTPWRRRAEASHTERA